MSAATAVEPTTRQQNEAARIMARYGRSEWSMRANGCMVIRAWGDNPEPDDKPVMVVLNTLGRPIAASGRPRKRSRGDVEM